eukprot:gnl/MRDRNA2_/MRDRNA2_56510_c0_seq2.p1 gnl/MRDRNA2_/MRDRNA2_56510_c0~~gnl/MRDRNA2_/MRDRNA2_56510_c0_seq2.p1  ORF type:complete len:447 (-),score=57.91 gnl/MRDRNA2_/MRDRNA2_56510_c0_seq2:234-1574(-)
MMRAVTVNILLECVLQVWAVNYIDNAEDSTGKFDKFIDKFVDKLFQRVRKASSIHSTDLARTTFAKPSALPTSVTPVVQYITLLPSVTEFDGKELMVRDQTDPQDFMNNLVSKLTDRKLRCVHLGDTDLISTTLAKPKPAKVELENAKEKKAPVDLKAGTFWNDLVLGGVSGAIVKTAMAPLERVKILMQTQDSNPKILSGELRRYRGMVDCFRRVGAEQGLKSFWRGNLVNCMRYAPQQGSALAFNDLIKASFPKFDPVTQYWESFASKLLAGGCAGSLANLVCYPFDYARTRLASDVMAGKGQFNGIYDCIMTTVKKGGIGGLYQGSGVTVAGAFVYRAGQLGLFGQIMDMNPYKDDTGIAGIGAAFLIANIARSVTIPFNYPFDTVRRRMMLESEKVVAARLYKNGFDCFTKVMATEGLAGMYKGVGPEMIRGIGGPLVLRTC